MNEERDPRPRYANRATKEEMGEAFAGVLEERARGNCCEPFRKRTYDRQRDHGHAGAVFVRDDDEGWALYDDDDRFCFWIYCCPFCGVSKVWRELQDRLEAEAANADDGR